MFGSNSAFGAFPTSAAPARPRRQPSAGSFKEEGKSTANSSGPVPTSERAGPSLGRWSSLASPVAAPGSAGPATTAPNGASTAAPGASVRTDATPSTRSFSSILSPSLDTSAAEEAFDPAQPFVYSRAFLLSLYDEDKAAQRPIELSGDEVATRETGRRPWGLSDWRQGEKEVSLVSPCPSPQRTGASPWIFFLQSFFLCTGQGLTLLGISCRHGVRFGIYWDLASWTVFSRDAMSGH